jgi:hypothetical protein
MLLSEKPGPDPQKASVEGGLAGLPTSATPPLRVAHSDCDPTYSTSSAHRAPLPINPVT